MNDREDESSKSEHRMRGETLNSDSRGKVKTLRPSSGLASK